MKKIVMIVGLLAVVAVIVFFVLRNTGDEPKYRTEKVTRGDIVSAVTATGTVNPVTTVLVGTQVSGTIKYIYVDFNSPVKQGQLIAQIDPATFEAQVEQARANLLSAQANLKKSEAALADAGRTLERNRGLLPQGFVSRAEFDTSETNYDAAMAQLDASKAQVAQTAAALSFAETNLRYTKILSPVDGTVVQRAIDVGQTVAASFQTPTLFTIAQDLKKMQLDTNVAEADIGKVVVGQDVEFTVDAYPEHPFRGRVSQIRIAPITVQNVVTYDVVITVDNSDLKLKPGMTANVSIITSSKQNVLRIPNAALRYRHSETPETGKGGPKGPGVWILQEGIPKRVRITPGISDGTFTEAVSEDLKEGQEVIVESLSKAKKGPQTQVGPRMF
jgi:HlyD family secretion protein